MEYMAWRGHYETLDTKELTEIWTKFLKSLFF